MNIDTLRTPSFLIDLNRFEQNCKRLAYKAESLQLDFSPHVKTHKTIEGGIYQRSGRLCGITVSTMAEAEYFADNDYQKITYAFPITVDKLPDVLEISQKIELFRIVTDQEETITEIQRFAEEQETSLNVFLKINTGANRAGINADSPRLISLAKMLAEAPNINWVGILSHAGHTYSAKNKKEIEELAKAELEVLKQIKKRLAEENLVPEVISIGDTPGCSVLDDFVPATELRPGNYTLYDRMQSDIGSCEPNDVAGFVLSRVIAHYPERNTMLIGAGALALSKDPGSTHVRKDGTYGGILDNENLKLVKLSQEHGLITSDEPINYMEHPLGSFITVVPNHSCLTAALFDHYIILDNIFDRNILDTWKPVRGW